MTMLEIFLAQDPVIKYSYDDKGGVVAVEYHDFESDIPDSALVSYHKGDNTNTFKAVNLNGDGVGLLDKSVAGTQC